jgi:hypothetical protein
MTLSSANRETRAKSLVGKDIIGPEDIPESRKKFQV